MTMAGEVGNPEKHANLTCHLLEVDKVCQFRHTPTLRFWEVVVMYKKMYSAVEFP